MLRLPQAMRGVAGPLCLLQFHFLILLLLYCYWWIFGGSSGLRGSEIFFVKSFSRILINFVLTHHPPFISYHIGLKPSKGLNLSSNLGWRFWYFLFCLFYVVLVANLSNDQWQLFAAEPIIPAIGGIRLEPVWWPKLSSPITLFYPPLFISHTNRNIKMALIIVQGWMHGTVPSVYSTPWRIFQSVSKWSGVELQQRCCKI